MNKILIALTLSTFLAGFVRQTGVETKPALDQSNQIRNHLQRIASNITHRASADVQSLADWQKARPERYRRFLEMMSLYDVPLEGPRPPLNVRVVGVIKQDGFRIEKLHYQSLPQLYVPANLYIPEGITKRRPAILYVCGHSPTQKVHYQAHARQFAKLGFVCLIIETVQWGEVRGEHWGCYARGWFHWYSRGYTPGGVEVWNAVRGLDLLCRRKEVDPERLGVTGISGGGAQTWFIAAADSRIKAAAAVCGASTLEAHLHTRTIDGHCDCMMPINTFGWDFHDIGALVAPRPFLIGQADRDGLNTIESVRELYQGIKKIYDLHGASDRISLVETPGGHSYHRLSRQKIFSFFLKHLMGKDVPFEQIEDIDESEKAPLSENDLRVYVNGPPNDDRTKTIQDGFITLAEPPAINSPSDLAQHRQRVIQFLRENTFSGFPAQAAPFDARLEFRSDDGGRHGRTTWSFVSEKDWRLRIDIRWSRPQDQRNPLMLILRSPDEERSDSERFAAGLEEQGNVAYLETRGVGETGWAPELSWHVRRASAWTGRTVASMRVYDVLRAMEFLKTLPGVQSESIGLAARDEMAVVALYAALLAGDCAAVILKNPPETQNAPSRPDGRGESIEMLNCLRITDVNRIPGLLCPASVTFVGKPPESYTWSQELYEKLGQGGLFKIHPPSADED